MEGTAHYLYSKNPPINFLVVITKNKKNSRYDKIIIAVYCYEWANITKL